MEQAGTREKKTLKVYWQERMFLSAHACVAVAAGVGAAGKGAAGQVRGTWRQQRHAGKPQNQVQQRHHQREKETASTTSRKQA
jgi:hypothetical protein